MSRKIQRSLIFIFFTGCVLLMISSCKTSDDQITKTVTTVAGAVAPKVTVKVFNGVVTLDGVIPDTLTKLDLDTAIIKMKGVVALHDHTTLQPLPDEIIHRDKGMTRVIDSALQANNIKGIHVNVYNGVVTLNGTITAKDFKTLQKLVDHAHPKKVLNGLVVK